MERTLFVRITNKCNLNCSFCRAKEYMQLDDLGIDVFKSALEKANEHKPVVETVIWSGGEPLLSSTKWKQAREIIKAKFPAVTEVLVTNGMYVKQKLFKELMEMSFIEVSIDGYSASKSERSFEQLLKAGSYDLLEYIGASKNVAITSVITKDRIRDYKWHEDLIELYKRLLPLGINSLNLSFDEFYKGPMSTDEMVNFVIGYDVLKSEVLAINSRTGIPTRLNVKKFFEATCTGCDNYITVETDGSVTKEQPVPDLGVGGCNAMAAALGAEAYAYLNSFFKAERDRENESRTGSNE